MPSTDAFISVLAPLHDDAAIVDDFVRETSAVLSAHFANYEIVLVDDGSKDGTADKAASLLDRYPCCRLIRLSRRFGMETAITAGLDSAVGDFAAILLPAMDPPDKIPDIVRLAREGADIVFGIRRNRKGDPVWLRLGAGLFFRWAEPLFGVRIPKSVTHFRVLSRPVINALARTQDSQRYLSLLGSSLGYSSRSYLYDPIERSPRRRKSFPEAVQLAVNIIIANSLNPLHFVTLLGLAASLINLLYVAYIVGIRLFKPHVAEGWTTLSLQTAGMFFFVFLILTVLGEYLGRVLIESKNRFPYHVLEDKSSSVMVPDEGRKNVVLESSPKPSPYGPRGAGR